MLNNNRLHQNGDAGRAAAELSQKPATQVSKKELRALIARRVDSRTESDTERLAGNLETARDLWRQYPGLVTAREIPAALQDYGCDDSNIDQYDLDLFAPKAFRSNVIERALSWAMHRRDYVTAADLADEATHQAFDTIHAEKATKKAISKVLTREDYEENWQELTPLDTDYQLVMFDCGGDSLQFISMSRSEYISLKEALAQMRLRPIAAAIVSAGGAIA